MVESIDDLETPLIYDIGAVFHKFAKEVKHTPYLAYNFQRLILGERGLIHNCEGIDVQDAVLDVFLGCHQIEMLASTGGDGTLAKVTTAARKALDSQSADPDSRSIDDVLFLHNMAGTQNVIAAYYGLPKFWQLAFAAGVHKYRNCGKDSLKVHHVPQLKVASSYNRDHMTYRTEDYGCMFTGAVLNKFLSEHYRMAKMLEPIPHSFADLEIIARGAVQPDYAKDFLRPMQGNIKLDGKDLPIDSWNFILVFSNDWNIDMKLTNLSPCMKLRQYHDTPNNGQYLQVVVGNATMPIAINTVFRQAFGLDWRAKGFLSEVGTHIEIETEERQFNLDGDFHHTGGRVKIDSGYSFNLVGNHSEEYLKGAFSGNQELFNKFLDDFSHR